MNVINSIHPTARIGEGTKVWNFTYVGKDAQIGKNCKIGSLVHLDYGAKVGDNCLIEGSVYIPPLTVIGNNVFVGPAAVFTNDPYPPSGKMVGVTVEDGAVICAGAIIKAGVTIRKNTVVAMGALVTKDTIENEIVKGHPARHAYMRHIYDQKQDDWIDG